MSFAEITDLINVTHARLVVLLCHHNADPDAICSAYAFSSLLRQSIPQIDVEIGAAHGISRLSRHVLNHLLIEVTTQPSVEKADLIILIDTNTIQQLDDLAQKVMVSKAPIIVVDHHACHPETEQLVKISITDEAASSTCEIIYNFYEQAGIEPGTNEARALLLGVAFDTRHFVLASSATLKNVAKLIDVGVNVQETLPLLSLPMDVSERVARLKASKRTKLFKIGDWMIALSRVSAYQASAARALVELGAHVAAVAGEKDGNLEISMRSSQEFYKKTDIHLGKDIARQLGECLHGMGGGHATAAGVNGQGDVETALRHFLRLLKEKLDIHN